MDFLLSLDICYADVKSKVCVDTQSQCVLREIQRQMLFTSVVSKDTSCVMFHVFHRKVLKVLTYCAAMSVKESHFCGLTTGWPAYVPSGEHLGWSCSPLSTRGGGHVLQTLFPKPSCWGDVAPTVSLLCIASCCY